MSQQTAEQPFLSDEMTPQTDEVITLAAETYRKLRDERMEIQKRENSAQENLVFVMRSKNLTQYDYDGRNVLLINGKIKAKVKSTSKEDEGDDE